MTAPGWGTGQAHGHKQVVTGLRAGQEHPGGSLGRWAARAPKASSTQQVTPSCLPCRAGSGPGGPLLSEHGLRLVSTTGPEAPPSPELGKFPWHLGGPGHLPGVIHE